MRVGLAIAAAIGIGYLVGKFAGQRAGQMAIVGGLAGATAQALGAFSPIAIPGIGSGSSALMLGSGGFRRIGESQLISPSMSREGENVQLIQP